MHVLANFAFVPARPLDHSQRLVATALAVVIVLLASAGLASANPKYAGLVIDVNTGRTLYAENADAKRYPASLTKIMTLYIVFEELAAGRLRLDTKMRVSAFAAGRPPSKIGLRPGGTVKVRDAIKALVTKSANDVASVVAEHIEGSERAFAKRMTATARRLGMGSTTFRNPHGLPNSAQRTTARDMARLGIAVQRDFPQYYGVFQTRVFKLGQRSFGNHNRLLGRVKGVDGIKTGYIRASGFNLVTSVRRDGRHLVAVVMGGRTGASRNAHMTKLVERYLPKATKGVPMPLIAWSDREMAPVPGRKPVDGVLLARLRGVADGGDPIGETVIAFASEARNGLAAPRLSAGEAAVPGAANPPERRTVASAQQPTLLTAYAAPAALDASQRAPASNETPPRSAKQQAGGADTATPNSLAAIDLLLSAPDLVEAEAEPAQAPEERVALAPATPEATRSPRPDATRSPRPDAPVILSFNASVDDEAAERLLRPTPGLGRPAHAETKAVAAALSPATPAAATSSALHAPESGGAEARGRAMDGRFAAAFALADTVEPEPALDRLALVAAIERAMAVPGLTIIEMGSATAPAARANRSREAGPTAAAPADAGRRRAASWRGDRAARSASIPSSGEAGRASTTKAEDAGPGPIGLLLGAGEPRRETRSALGAGKPRREARSGAADEPARSEKQWLIQLGAVNTREEALGLLADAQADQPALNRRERLAVPVRANGRTLYRARLAGFASRSDAAAACQRFANQDRPCWAMSM